MSISNHCLPPSSSLPPIKRLLSATKTQISTALHNLQAIYCPLRLPTVLPKDKPVQAAYVDSGYVSEDDEAVTQDEEESDASQVLAALRLDEFERNYAIRWLTSLVSRAEELSLDEDERETIIDEASFILSSFSDPTDDSPEEALVRDFFFPTPFSTEPVSVRLNDAPLSGIDHTDVGLQSWGASIVFSKLLCASPERFGLDELTPSANILELGAGTGLISLTLAKLIPLLHPSAEQTSIMATDYHPTVLENLRANIVASFPTSGSADASYNSADAVSPPITTQLLDWSSPPADLAGKATALFASDVVYAPEHAAWLRDCAAHLLAPKGIFWLVVTVRSTGKFEGIPDTAEAAFDGTGGLQILEKWELEKERGVGRGDEKGYMVFRIGWAEV